MLILRRTVCANNFLQNRDDSCHKSRARALITAGTFTAANIDERGVCPELAKGIKGFMIGDKGFIRPELQKELGKSGLNLQTPLRDNMKDNRPKKLLNWMKNTRRLIETVICQLTERFHIEKVRARD